MLHFTPVAACLLVMFQPFKIGASAQQAAYTVQQAPLGTGVQYKCLYDSHHFLTVIDDNGMFAIRPHPGVDVNGWGSTLHLQPFLPGATLKHSVVNEVTVTTTGISVRATGQVSRGENETFGTWEAELEFQCVLSVKKVTGSGTYGIQLSNSLSSTTGDLNLFKIASNYLDEVPTLRGVLGDTGDMQLVLVEGQAINQAWIPPEQPGFYPQNQTDWLSINVIGALNDVDTAAQGSEPIDPAYKPSLRLTLTSQEAGIPMIFGGQYDLAFAQLFSADNVGVTPLVLRSSTALQYGFSLDFNSQALSADGNDQDFDGIQDGVDICPDTIFRVPVDEHGCPPPVKADFDRDGDVDEADLAAFVACTRGPAVALPFGCNQMDLDQDSDADSADFAVVQRCFSGENRPADPDCR